MRCCLFARSGRPPRALKHFARGFSMRKQWILSAGVAVVAGALGGALVSPTPLGAVSKEIVELRADSRQLLQGQRDMQSSMETKMSELLTPVHRRASYSIS